MIFERDFPALTLFSWINNKRILLRFLDFTQNDTTKINIDKNEMLKQKKCTINLPQARDSDCRLDDRNHP